VQVDADGIRIGNAVEVRVLRGQRRERAERAVNV
jgi:hypothetical protein